MEDIASKRRDNVDLCKKIFLYVKLAAMFVLSILGSIFFVWSMYYNQLNLNRYQPTVEGCLKYCDENITLIISSVICCIVSCAFVAFLALHGIQTLVVKYMMRHANTGG